MSINELASSRTYSMRTAVEELERCRVGPLHSHAQCRKNALPRWARLLHFHGVLRSTNGISLHGSQPTTS